jgi:hypothetical protein
MLLREAEQYAGRDGAKRTLDATGDNAGRGRRLVAKSAQR